MKRMWILVVTLLLLLGLNACGKEQKIYIQIPAEQEDEFIYSETQILPHSDTITIRQTEPFGDCEVAIRRVAQDGEVTQRTYLTPGVSSELSCEKGLWYKIGVRWSNPDEEPREVGLTVTDVEVENP